MVDRPPEPGEDRKVIRWLADNAHVDFSLARKRKDKAGMLAAWLAHASCADMWRDVHRAEKAAAS